MLFGGFARPLLPPLYNPTLARKGRGEKGEQEGERGGGETRRKFSGMRAAALKSQGKSKSGRVSQQACAPPCGTSVRS